MHPEKYNHLYIRHPLPKNSLHLYPMRQHVVKDLVPVGPVVVRPFVGLVVRPVVIIDIDIEIS